MGIFFENFKAGDYVTFVPIGSACSNNVEVCDDEMGSEVTSDGINRGLQIGDDGKVIIKFEDVHIYKLCFRQQKVHSVFVAHLYPEYIIQTEEQVIPEEPKPPTALKIVGQENAARAAAASVTGNVLNVDETVTLMFKEGTKNTWVKLVNKKYDCNHMPKFEELAPEPPIAPYEPILLPTRKQITYKITETGVFRVCYQMDARRLTVWESRNPCCRWTT